MAKKSFINKILQNTRKPEGFFGRLVLRGMNRGHASLARWGMGCMEWQAEWSVLDIGCGGGERSRGASCHARECARQGGGEA